MRARILLIVPALLSMAVLPVRAQVQPSPTPAPVLPQIVRVASISPWTDATHPFALTVQVTNTTEVALVDVSVRVTFFSRVNSRSELRAALDTGSRSAAVTSITEPIDGEIPPGDQRSLAVTRTLAQLPRLSRSGVYPMQIAVRHSTGQTSALTALPVFVSAPRAPINVVWVMPVSRPIAAPGADGIYDQQTIDALGLDELTQQMSVIGRRIGAAVTFAISPALLDTLADLSDGYASRTTTGVNAQSETSAGARLAAGALTAIGTAASASAHEIATVPYAPVDLPSLAARGLVGDLLKHIALGREVTRARLGRAPVSAVLVPPRNGADEPSATALAPLGVEGVVLDQANLTEAITEPFRPDQFGPSRPVAVRTGATEMRALIPDAPLSQRLDGPEQGVLLAQAVLAETASAFFELPLFAPDRVLTMTSVSMPSPTALGASLDGLSTAPWVKLRAASDAIGSLAPQADPMTFVEQPAPDRSFLAGARRARRNLSTLLSITVEPQPEFDTLDRQVLLAESAEWESDPGTGAAIAQAVSERVHHIIEGIGIANRVVTLTSRKGRFPLTLLNANPFPVHVLVRLISTKLNFPKGATQTLDIAGPNQQVDVLVEARAAGSFPLEVHIETADGKHLLASGTLVLRSTVVSAVALGVVGGSALLLIVSWVRRTSRRQKKASPP